MKKILITVFAIGIALTSFSQKGFEKGNMYNSFSLGYQSYINLGSWNLGGWGGNWGGFRARGLTLQYQAEWGVHDYVGIGFHTGATLNFGRWWGVGSSIATYIPIGVQGNFHFYQLIDDKTSSDIKSDMLDIYAGLGLGGGPVLWNPTNDGLRVRGGMHIGPHVGVRYYPTEKFGIFAEMGYGRSLAMFGIVLR